MHDISTFGANIAALIKRSGDSGDTGDTRIKSFSLREKSVTAFQSGVSPVHGRPVTPRISTGDAKASSGQLVSKPVTAVTGVTACFRQAVTLPQPSSQALQKSQGLEGWWQGLQQLDAREPPDSFRADRWRMLIEDGAAFLSHWGDQALALGWREVDVFGVHAQAPAARVGCYGLALLIQGGVVAAVSENTAALVRSSGARLMWHRSHCEEMTPIWKLIGEMA